ncbi:MAG: hypothetical protein NC126_02160 [Clostridium sp.]|nr:hypothetical protein [Clostridium sp.]
MKRTIYISKEAIFIWLFFFAGIVLFVHGANSLLREKKSIELHALSERDCMKGQYVRGNVDAYLVKDIVNLGNGGISGVSQELVLGITEYAVCTMPIEGNKYIQIMFSDKDKMNALKNNRKNIYIEGEIVRSPIDVNYQWYEHINNCENFSSENIISEYVIKEIQYAQKEQWMYIGLLLLVFSIILYLMKRHTLINVQDIERL